MGRASGYTYMTVLFIVMIMGVGLALAGQAWRTAAARDREAELLHVGNQYRKAIERYYLSGSRQYPRSLEDLLKDPRQPRTERYLRRLYPDPVTGKTEWGFIKAPDGGIMGVHSLSGQSPLKVANFHPRDRALTGAMQYSDWKFVFTAAATRAAAAPKPAP